MGWSCTKHEWDEGSLNWQDCAQQVAEEVKHLADAPDSRPLSPCPECVRELLRARDTEITHLKEQMLKRFNLAWALQRTLRSRCRELSSVLSDSEMALYREVFPGHGD